jgi:hypothetical protein
VQLSDNGRCYGDRSLARKDPVQSPAIASEFFLAAIPRPCLSQHNGPKPAGVDHDAFDPIPGLDALNDRLLAKNCEHLGFLPGPEILFAFRFHASSQ